MDFRLRTSKGQTITETLIWLPFVLIFVFGAIQIAQIGVGLVVVNYQAGSIARKIARSNGTAAGIASQHSTDFNRALSVGMQNGTLDTCENVGGGATSVTSNVQLVASARIAAFPLIGPMVDSAAPDFKASKDWTLAHPCKPQPVPAVGFTGSPDYEFIVRGSAVARRNYLQ